MSQIVSIFPVNEIELTYRQRHEILPLIVDGHDVAADILRCVWRDDRIELLEEFKVLLLDRSGHCLGVVDIASGGLESCMVDTRLIFVAALKAKATRIILAHNHPSGNLEPSKADLKVTNKLCEGGKILDIPVEDHIILTRSGYTSMAAKNLLPYP